MWDSASSKQHFLASENYHKCGMFLQTMPKRGSRHVGESHTRLGSPPPPRLTIEKGKREPQHPGSPPPPPPPPRPLWLRRRRRLACHRMAGDETTILTAAEAD